MRSEKRIHAVATALAVSISFPRMLKSPIGHWIKRRPPEPKIAGSSPGLVACLFPTPGSKQISIQGLAGLET